MGYIGKITAGGATHLVGSTLYGTCGTSASTKAKVVTCANFNELTDGVTIKVKFTYSNTNAAPTLNVNSTGAKNIYRYGTTAIGKTVTASWQAGQVVSFTYVVSGSTGYWYCEDTGVRGTTASIGSASDWSAGTPTAVTSNTVITGATVSDGLLTLTAGDACTVTAGTAPSLTVTSTTVVTG